MPVLQPISISSGVDWLVGHIRDRINDQKYVHTFEIQENAGLATGAESGWVYQTKNMPIATDLEHKLRVDRWIYTEVDTIGDAVGLRAYIWSETSGTYHIPTGAIQPASGERVKLSYAWYEEQPYKFTDNELKGFLQAAITEVQEVYYDFDYNMAGVGASLDIVPNPGATDIGSYMFAMYTVYLIKKRLEEEGFDNRLVVRDMNVSIDLSRGLGELTKSSRELYETFKGHIKTLKFAGQEAAFARIDTYSSRPPDVDNYKWETNYVQDDQYF